MKKNQQKTRILLFSKKLFSVALSSFIFLPSVSAAGNFDTGCEKERQATVQVVKDGKETPETDTKNSEKIVESFNSKEIDYVPKNEQAEIVIEKNLTATDKDKKSEENEMKVFDLIERELSTQEKTSGSEEDYLRNIKQVMDYVGTLNINEFAESIIHKMEKKLESSPKDARIHYVIDYFGWYCTGDIKKQYRDLASEASRKMLINWMLKEDTGKNKEETKAAKDRIIKMLILANLGKVRYAPKINIDDVDAYADEWKLYKGNIFDLFAYGHSVVYDIKETNSESSQKKNVEKLFNLMCGDGKGGAEVSSHWLEMKDGDVVEKSVSVTGQIKKLFDKIVDNSIGNSMGIDINPGRSYAKNNLLMSVRGLSKNGVKKYGLLTKIESVVPGKTNRYGHKHDIKAKSEQISAFAAIRKFSPSKLRNGGRVVIKYENIEKLKKEVERVKTSSWDNVSSKKERQNFLEKITGKKN